MGLPSLNLGGCLLLSSSSQSLPVSPSPLTIGVVLDGEQAGDGLRGGERQRSWTESGDFVGLRLLGCIEAVAAGDALKDGTTGGEAAGGGGGGALGALG